MKKPRGRWSINPRLCGVPSRPSEHQCMQVASPCSVAAKPSQRWWKDARNFVRKSQHADTNTTARTSTALSVYLPLLLPRENWMVSAARKFGNSCWLLFSVPLSKRSSSTLIITTSPSRDSQTLKIRPSAEKVGRQAGKAHLQDVPRPRNPGRSTVRRRPPESQLLRAQCQD